MYTSSLSIAASNACSNYKLHDLPGSMTSSSLSHLGDKTVLAIHRPRQDQVVNWKSGGQANDVTLPGSFNDSYEIEDRDFQNVTREGWHKLRKAPLYLKHLFFHANQFI